jgi:hypothetical protein
LRRRAAALALRTLLTDRARAYVGLQATQELGVIDLASRRVTRRIPFSGKPDGIGYSTVFRGR